MRSIKALITKQFKDVFKNYAILLQIVLFPIIAYVMTVFVAVPNEYIPDNMFVNMFAAMYIGMTPLIMASSAIAEDRERKSLRFLVMAGVKPSQYLFGVLSFAMFAAIIVSVVFALIAGFRGVDVLIYTGLLTLGGVASAMVGAIAGIFSKNQQAATALATPLAMVFAITPMLATFNESVSRFTWFLFSIQLDNVMQEVTLGQGFYDVDLSRPLIIIGANIVVFVVLFAVAYIKKGLRG